MTTPYQTLALPVDSIQSHPENDFTMDESEMQELVASIRSEGLGQLPLVRKLPDGAYQMIAGHRRLEAYRRLAPRGRGLPNHPGHARRQPGRRPRPCAAQCYQPRDAPAFAGRARRALRGHRQGGAGFARGRPVAQGACARTTSSHAS